MEISELQSQLIILQEELRKVKQEKQAAQSEIAAARESEERMLDSLISQTKILEQTKISLEEAKLEISHLRSTIPVKGSPQRETQKLRAELKRALTAEIKSNKALDDLAILLKEVTAESNHAKRSYFQAQSELERLRAEMEESSATWRAKENGLIQWIKISEEEISCTKKENKRLTEARKATRQEISNLRDIVKQAIKETSIVKEALEITRNENAQLKNLLSEKENNFETVKQNSRVTRSAQELSGLNDLNLSMDSSGFGFDSFDGEGGGRPPLVKYPSDNWSARWKSIGDSNAKLLEGSIFDALAPSSPRREHNGGFGEQETFQMNSPMAMKKKRQGFRLFGSMLRMGSFHK
ncbi:cingulin-like protein 1 [Asparagus officinalis]|uniref:cingulin-like protein 1 n=1 Tax=Asparagus officinalis TaxID=4686 RepID=UPI00098E3BAA|nr:cingulin-like protein 1 [Asparagus officinalis]